MKRTFSLVVALLLVALLGCEQAPAPTQPLFNNQTAIALTQTAATSARTVTPTSATAPTAPAVTPNPEDTMPTPGSSPQASPESASGTATPHAQPAQDGFSYCGTSFGEGAGERFSAQLQAVDVETTGDVERLTLRFAVEEGQLHGSAECLLPAAAEQIDGDAAALLQVQLPNWAHDERFSASAELLESAVPLSGTQIVSSAALRADPNRSAGLVVELGLAEPVPFAARVEGDSVIVELALAPQTPYGNDPLSQEQNAPSLAADEALYFIQGGDLWSVTGDAAAPLAQTPELETGLAVSPDGNQLAFCRAASAAAPALGTLWISQKDGSEPRRLADVGGCADPAFSPHGDRIFFVAPLAPTPPLVFQLWSVELSSGAVQQLTFLDEWSRRNPQALADGSVISIGSADPDRTVLLLDRPSGESSELSAELLGLGAYTGISSALLAPDGRSIAVEAPQVGGGADLALLDTNGKLLATVTDGYWNRPLAWGRDGTLYYLRTVCESGLLLSYQIRALSGGQDRLIVEGAMSADIGAAIASESGLALVRQPPAHTAPRGRTLEPAAPAELWLLAPTGGHGQLHASQEPIEMLRP